MVRGIWYETWLQRCLWREYHKGLQQTSFSCSSGLRFGWAANYCFSYGNSCGVLLVDLLSTFVLAPHLFMTYTLPLSYLVRGWLKALFLFSIIICLPFVFEVVSNVDYCLIQNIFTVNYIVNTYTAMLLDVLFTFPLTISIVNISFAAFWVN